MKFPMENCTVDYTVLASGDKMDDDYALFFDITHLQKVIIIDRVAVADDVQNKILEMTAALKEFAKSFDNEVIIYALVCDANTGQVKVSSINEKIILEMSGYQSFVRYLTLSSIELYIGSNDAADKLFNEADDNLAAATVSDIIRSGEDRLNTFFEYIADVRNGEDLAKLRDAATNYLMSIAASKEPKAMHAF